MKKIILKKNQERRIQNGYPWIFSNEIAGTDSDIESGSIVRVESSHGRFICTGFYNKHSLISVRWISNHEQEIDKPFFLKRLKRAAEYRERIYPGTESCRLVYGESDLLPGLTVDSYSRNLSIKITSRGMLRYLECLCEALDDIIKPENIYYRVDETAAQYEDMETRSGWLKGSDPGLVTIVENGLKYMVDIANGQKTGFFHDQRDNRFKTRSYSTGLDILDLYCYTGAFSLSAAKGSARHVTGIDSSAPAIVTAKSNASLNEMEKIDFIVSDSLFFLKECMSTKQRYDMIILDPPAMIQTKRSFRQGYKKYVNLNILAMRCLKKGGMLFSSSCSWHLDMISFHNMLNEAASKTSRHVRIAEYGYQAKDHPILPQMPETSYLKGAFCYVY